MFSKVAHDAGTLFKKGHAGHSLFNVVKHGANIISDPAVGGLITLAAPSLAPVVAGANLVSRSKLLQ